MGTRDYRLLREETFLGNVSLDRYDMPWWHGTFDPTEAWDDIKDIFHAWQEVEKTGDQVEMIRILELERSLNLSLEPLEEADLERDFLLHIDTKGRVRLRLRFFKPREESAQ